MLFLSVVVQQNKFQFVQRFSFDVLCVVLPILIGLFVALTKYTYAVSRHTNDYRLQNWILKHSMKIVWKIYIKIYLNCVQNCQWKKLFRRNGSLQKRKRKRKNIYPESHWVKLCDLLKKLLGFCAFREHYFKVRNKLGRKNSAKGLFIQTITKKK